MATAQGTHLSPAGRAFAYTLVPFPVILILLDIFSIYWCSLFLRLSRSALAPLVSLHYSTLLAGNSCINLLALCTRARALAYLCTCFTSLSFSFPTV